MTTITLTVQIDGNLFSSLDRAAGHLEAELERRVNEGMVAVGREMRKALEQVYTQLERKHGRSWPLGGAPFGTDPSRQRLGRRSGRGLRSIKDSIQVRSGRDNLYGQISTGRLTVHETGAVITAKRAKYLALPMIDALNSRGEPIYSSPRHWRNTFVARSKRGNLIIFQRLVGGKVVPLYMLKRKVRMPARLGLGQTFERMVPIFTARAVNELERALS